jgi:hypothetical protein
MINEAMVILDFQVDENVLTEDRQYNPTIVDPGVIEATYYMMPVRFRIDGKELLQTPTTAWLPQPLLGFATHLVYALRTLHSTGAAIYSVADGGTLRFLRRGMGVQLTCDFNRVEAEVSLDELDAAIQHFHRRVEDWLRTHVPELVTHSSWPTWFPRTDR